MEIELSVQINEEDYIQINREINKRTKRPLITWFFLFVLWILLPVHFYLL